MTCFGATINCSNIDSNIANINLIFGYVGPTGSSSNGTIVFFTGDGGVASTLGATNAFAADYVGSYTIVYVDWASDWEQISSTASEENILEAACRPATFMSYINGSSTIHPSGAMCAQGKSAGSAAIAYSMSWYGAGKTRAGGYLTNVELLAGPVLSEIDQGCTADPPNVSICSGESGQPTCETNQSGNWTTSAGYTPNDSSGIDSWAGLPTSGSGSCGMISGTDPTLQHMSIVNGQYGTVTPAYIFNTTRHGWLCAGPVSNYYDSASDCYIGTGTIYCPNNSSPQGWYWYLQAGDSDNNLVVTGTNSCKGTLTDSPPMLYETEAEGVEGGFDGSDTTESETLAIEADMTSKCKITP